jgi:hypothetical protein
MAKNVFLFVQGSDYSAMDFEQNFNPQQVYEGMVKDRVTLKIFETDEFYIEVRVLSFQDIDPTFIDFIRDYIMDYDDSKSKDFIRVNPVA